MHSLQYAYRDRRPAKAISVSCGSAHQRSRSTARDELQPFRGRPAGRDVEVDRKVLADLAVRDDTAFAALVEVARSAAPAGGADESVTA